MNRPADDAGAPHETGASTAIRSDEELPVLPDFVDPDDDSQVWTRGDLGWLLLITILAAFARVAGLGQWALWVDEVHTVRDATKPLAEFWNTNVANYPLASLVVRALVDQFPSFAFDPSWLRLPFAFAGILTVPLLAIVGRSMLGRRAAFVGALFLALSPWHIYWSQNVRGYALLALFTVGSIGMFWVGIQRRSWFSYAVSLALLVLAGLTHPTGYAIGGLFVVAMFLMLWARPGVYRTGLLVWFVLIGIALLGVGWFLAREQLEWFQSAKSRPSPVHFAQTVGFFFRLTLLGAAACAVVALRRGRDRGSVVFVALWASVPILAILVLSLIAQTTAQYAFAALPGVCLLAGAACAEVARRLEASGVTAKTLRYALPLVLAADLASYDALYLTKQHGDRPRWKDAANLVLERTEGSSIVLSTNEPSMMFYLHPEFYLGADREGGRIEVFGIESWDVERAQGAGNLFREWRRRAEGDGRRLFVALTTPELHEKDPSLAADSWLRAHARQVARFPCWAGPKDMTVLVYEVAAPEDGDD